jgi:hypothetical protein
MDTNTTIDHLFPSKWLKSSDLGSTARIATISKIDFELVGNEKEKKAVVSFQNTTKRLILNRTNAQTLAYLYGPTVLAWIGKKIILYSAEVLFRGMPTQAIRIKEEIPGTPKVEPQPVPEADTANDEPPWSEEEMESSF